MAVVSAAAALTGMPVVLLALCGGTVPALASASDTALVLAVEPADGDAVAGTIAPDKVRCSGEGAMAGGEGEGGEPGS